ncbi:hypothetical protein JOC77_000331 [Peribacillus deserti]|uniref:Uncharacterized protein n=1 Tax=Peribacillus deserti TaxID=673318 RepID=A0ABS2QCQ8_9BACI|nr:hypothetical protein [Peribacillus deserti]MBM7690928.1 hypothetical protein [Peribacillus deserti]
MSSNVKKGIFWGAIAVSIIFLVQFVINLLNSLRPYDSHPGPRHMGRGHGQGPGFEPRHFAHGPHQGGDFAWIGWLLFLAVALAAVVLIFKWLRKKNDSFQSFVNIPLTGPAGTVNESNADVLDTWEKNKQ